MPKRKAAVIRIPFSWILMAIVSILTACTRSGDPGLPLPGSISSQPLPARPTVGQEATLFAKLPAQETGIDFAIRMVPDHRFSYLNHTPYES